MWSVWYVCFFMLFCLADCWYCLLVCLWVVCAGFCLVTDVCCVAFGWLIWFVVWCFGYLFIIYCCLLLWCLFGLFVYCVGFVLFVVRWEFAVWLVIVLDLGLLTVLVGLCLPCWFGFVDLLCRNAGGFDCVLLCLIVLWIDGAVCYNLFIIFIYCFLFNCIDFDC